MPQGQGVPRNHNHQHQQNRHHTPGHPLNAALNAVVHDQRRHPGEQQGEHNGRNRGSDKGSEVAILGGGFRLSGQVHQGVFGDPAADHRIVGHDQHRHQEGNDPQELPFWIHFRVSADGALFCPAADGNIGHQQGKAKGQHQGEIDQQEQSAPVLGRQVGKPPQVPHPNSAPRRHQDKAQLSREVICFLFHVVYSSFILQD